jgi:type I restriction enzyme, S subunit
MAQWENATLGDVVVEMRNGVNCKQDKSGTGDKISRIETIANASFNFDRVGFATLTDSEREKHRLKQGDILFSHINSAIHVGKTAILQSDEEIFHGVNLMLLRASESLSPRFLDFYLKMIFRSGYWRNICKQSVNQASVNQKDIKKIPIQYPPLPEQQRIVSILDEAFEGIDAAITNTEKNLANARELFESYLNDVFTQKGDGWTKKHLGDISQRVSVGHVGPTTKFYCEEKDGIPFLRSQNVRPGNLNVAGLRYITKPFHASLRKSQLQAGDLLFVRVGANRGDCCAVPEDVGELNCANIVFARPLQVSVDFLVYYCQSAAGRQHLLGMTTGSAQGVINTKSVARLPVPLPPMDQQIQLVEDLDRVSTEIQCLDTNFQKKLTALGELKQSILRKAFSGELTGHEAAA